MFVRELYQCELLYNRTCVCAIIWLLIALQLKFEDLKQ